MKTRLSILFIFFSVLFVHADEGMWIPMLLQKYTIGDMQEKGFRLTAEDIYSVNKACLKDAVVIFGRGCTGEVVSDQGLVFTNHHCGYSYVQSHSSVEHDYLKNGFWARSREEELPNENISVTFLKRIEDVSKDILGNVSEDIDEAERQKIIKENIKSKIAKINNGNRFKVVIKPFYYGNDYYMFVYELFNDIRLVGAPPESVGNYGKDFDNWMWPRHTGDFSIFRIYADENNNPADYSPDNVPYKPMKHIPVSLKGVEENDFTMVLGYPGSTTSYFISDAINLYVNKTYPQKIAARTARLNVMEKYMKKDDVVRIQYAAKFRNVSNSWKKWMGIIKGINSVNAIAEKEQEEMAFTEWVNGNIDRKEKWGNVLPELKSLYAELSDYLLVSEYGSEIVMTNELMVFMLKMKSKIMDASLDSDNDKNKLKEELLADTHSFFKDYYLPIDVETYGEMLRTFKQDINVEFLPDLYSVIDSKFNANYDEYAKRQFLKSKFTSEQEFVKLINNYPDNQNKLLKMFEKDPLMQNFYSFLKMYSQKVNEQHRRIVLTINQKYRIYLQALLEKNKDKIMYPDANFTMRLAYGKVIGYNPKDAVKYDYYTNLSGIIEKYNTGEEDYSIPKKLLTLYEQKDYGQYADKNGQMPVCFVASNHTSGGNSGSPVMNADGQLIGLNFDRNWEGTMSDMFYDKDLCRNIVVDIRYVLFIIDKLGNAGYLIDELELVR